MRIASRKSSGSRPPAGAMPIRSDVGREQQSLVDRRDDGRVAAQIRQHVAHAAPGVIRIDDGDHAVRRVRDHAVRHLRRARRERVRREHDVSPRDRGAQDTLTSRSSLDAEAGTVGQHDLSAGVRNAGERVVRREERAVEIGPVHQRAQVRRGGREDLRLDHAAQHDLQAHRARGVDHLQRTANPAALDELHVDAVDAPEQRGQIVRVLRVFVGDERDGRALADPAELRRRTGGDGLLAELDLEPRELRQQLDGLFRRPAFVRVDADGPGVDRADSFDRLDLGAAAELHLDDGMRTDLAHLRERLVERCDADRERRARRARGIEAEQPPQRTVEVFADEVVQRDVEPALLRGRQPVEQPFERVRVVAEVQCFEPGAHARDVLVVAFAGRTLAEPLQPVPAQPHDRGFRDGLRRAGDGERVLERKIERLDGELNRRHAVRFSALAKASARAPHPMCGRIWFSARNRRPKHEWPGRSQSRQSR